MTSQKRVLDYCVWYLKFGSMIRLISTHLYVGGSGLGGHTQPLKLANADIIGLAVHDCKYLLCAWAQIKQASRLLHRWTNLLNCLSQSKVAIVSEPQ